MLNLLVQIFASGLLIYFLDNKRSYFPTVIILTFVIEQDYTLASTHLVCNSGEFWLLFIFLIILGVALKFLLFFLSAMAFFF